jgi:hypothetical protein
MPLPEPVRGDRHDVAGKAETLIEAGRRIGHPAQGETGGLAGRDQVPGLADFRDRAPPGRPMRDRLRAGRGSGLNGGRADAGSAARFALQSGPQLSNQAPRTRSRWPRVEPSPSLDASAPQMRPPCAYMA